MLNVKCLNRPAVQTWRCGAAGGDEAATEKAARAKQLDAMRQSLLTADLNAMLMPQLKTVCREVGIAVKGARLLCVCSSTIKCLTAHTWTTDLVSGAG